MMKGWGGEGKQKSGTIRGIFSSGDKVSDYQVLVEYCMSGTRSQTQRGEPAVVIETAGWKVKDRSMKLTRERVTMSKAIAEISGVWGHDREAGGH